MNATPDARLALGSLQFAYDVRGAGEPLLLLPGLTMRRTMWPDPLCDALAAQGFEVVRLDNRDGGDSSRIDAPPPDVRGAMARAMAGLPVRVPYRLEDMAEDALAAMAALGHTRFHVAGASMGGMIAQTMAIVAPERLRTLTSVMSSPGGRRNSLGSPAGLRALLAKSPATEEARLAQLLDTLRLLHGPSLPLDEPYLLEFARSHLAIHSDAAAARHLGAILESAGRRFARLHQVHTPTLVIHGTDDPLLPLRGARAMAQTMPNAELLEVRGMGHDFPREAWPLLSGAIASHAQRAAVYRQRSA